MDPATWSADGPATGRVGAMLGGWTVERALGGGPVCESFLVSRGAETGVLRVLREPWWRDERVRTEWARASWAANRFQHSRVTRVLEQATDERGAPVIVRAWAKGESLEAAVKRGAVNPTSALRLTEQLLDALEMAHAHGILHGALSPTNVVVTPRGTVRLVDFATTPGVLARRSGSSHALATSRVGPFLAPERRASPPGPATELADVWGAGACLHYALVGAPPPDDLGEAGLSGPDDATAVVLLALARDPAARYESAYAMLGDIRRVLAGKKPLLDGLLGPVPSQRAPALPPSSSGMRGLSGAVSLPSIPPSAGQWRGNLLLMAAIAVLVGLATFVLVRERLGDTPRAPASAETR